jgi:hypothetical protein
MLLLCLDWQAIVAQRGEMLERQVKTGKNRTTRTDREEPNPVLYGLHHFIWSIPVVPVTDGTQGRSILFSTDDG